MPDPKPHIIVIGAGPGGLTAAMTLAHRGFRVTIVEKRDRVGGRNAELKLGPYSFDTGPTFLHQKFVLDEMFQEAGRRSSDYLHFVRLDPMTRLTWDGVSLNTFDDRRRMSEEIERVFPGHREGFDRFMDDHAKKLRTIYPCLQRPYQTLASYLNPALLRAAPYVATPKSVVDVLANYFPDERLQLAFTFQAKYLGMSPWRCPALYSILAFSEYSFGVYHVQGGLCRISEAMAKVCEEHGVEIRLNAPVDEVLTQGRAIQGVRLESGETLRADATIVNADFAHAMTRLFKRGGLSSERMRKKSFSCSAFMLYLGVDRAYPREPHHHIVFADDYRRNVSEIQGEREVSEDMSIYVRHSSVTDPNVAPPGHSAIYMLIPTVNMRHAPDWDRLKADYRDKVLRRVERRTGMTDLRQHIVEERIITPADWQNRDVFLGAIFNLTHGIRQMLYLRPHNRYQGFDNCYLVGGGTHPGSGLPTIYESARITSNLISDRFAVPYETVNLASKILRDM